MWIVLSTVSVRLLRHFLLMSVRGRRGSSRPARILYYLRCSSRLVAFHLHYEVTSAFRPKFCCARLGSKGLDYGEAHFVTSAAHCRTYGPGTLSSHVVHDYLRLELIRSSFRHHSTLVGTLMSQKSALHN